MREIWLNCQRASVFCITSGFYLLKEEDDGTGRYKESLIVKEFRQREGIDFNKIFLSYCETNYHHISAEYCDRKDLHLEQLNVKTTFLRGNLEEDIYMLQP